MRKLICWLIGHRSKLLYHMQAGFNGQIGPWSENVWKCQCCSMLIVEKSDISDIIRNGRGE